MLFDNSLPTRFVYDGDGGRVKSIGPTGTTLFLGELYEVAPTGTATTYVYAGGQRIAALETKPSLLRSRADTALLRQGFAEASPKLEERRRATAKQSRSRLVRWLAHLDKLLAFIFEVPDAEAAGLPEGLRFYHGDHLGSVNVVTDGAGKLVESTTYQPFGSVHRREQAQPAQQAQPANRHGFTGQREDARNGLILFPARPYDPRLGRFLQPDPFVQDPADPQSLNRYSYVRNNPVNFVDPSGYKKRRHHFWQKVLAIVAAVVVSVITGNPELGLSLGVQLLAVGAAAAAGSAVGAQIDIAVARAGSSPSSADPGGASPRAPPSETGSFPSAGGPSLVEAGFAPLSATAVGASGAAGAVGKLLEGAGLSEFLVYLLLVYGTVKLSNAIADFFDDSQARQIIGYHATDASGASRIATEGFKLELSSKAARFGPGFYLASTPEGAIAERARHGLTTDAVLQVRARLTRNVFVPRSLAKEPMSRLVGEVVRRFGGSITYGSFAEPGVTNYVLFNPAEQQVGPAQIYSYGSP